MTIKINSDITENQLQEFFNRRGKRLDTKPMVVGFVKHGMVTAWWPATDSEYTANSYSQMFEMCFHSNDETDLKDAIELGMVTND